jgi:hypothetical protein
MKTHIKEDSLMGLRQESYDLNGLSSEMDLAESCTNRWVSLKRSFSSSSADHAHPISCDRLVKFARNPERALEIY